MKKCSWFAWAAVIALFVPITAMAHMPPIIVDGDPSDWIGVLPMPPHTSDCNNLEWLYTGVPNDERTDLDNPAPYGDILEVRFAADCENLYFLIQLADFDFEENVNIAITFDVDCDNDETGNKWIGDDSITWGSSIGTFYWWERQINIRNILGSNVIEMHAGGSWYMPPNPWFVAIDPVTNCVEGYIALEDLDMDCESMFVPELVTFKNDPSGWNNDIDSTIDIGGAGVNDGIDVMTCGANPGDNAWPRDLHDNQLDMPCPCIDMCLCFFNPPINDDCANAELLVCDAAPLRGDLCCATEDYDSVAGCGWTATTPDVWYTFTVPKASYVTFNVLPDPQVDVRFIVEEGACIPPAPGIKCVDDNGPGGLETWDSSTEPYVFLPGITYFVIVEATDYIEGHHVGCFYIDIDCVNGHADLCSELPDPPGDWGQWTVDIDTEIPFNEIVDSTGYANDYDSSGCVGYGSAGPDIVIRIEGGATRGQYQFTWDAGSSEDEVIYLVTDCTDIAGSCVGGADDNAASYDETFSACLEPGVVYYWILDGYSSGSYGQGPATITYAGPCMADTCAEADADPANWVVDVATSLPVTKNVDTAGLANDYNASTCGSSSVGRGADAVITITNGGVTDKFVRFDWTGSSGGDRDGILLPNDCGLPCLHYKDSSPLDYCIRAGQTYHFVVDGYQSSTETSGPILITDLGACPDTAADTCTGVPAAWQVDVNTDLAWTKFVDTSEMADDYDALPDSSYVGRGRDAVIEITNSGAKKKISIAWAAAENNRDGILFEDDCATPCVAYENYTPLEYCIEPSHTYYFIVDGYYDNLTTQGDIVITDLGACDGDTCGTAFGKPTSSPVNGDTTGAGDNGDAATYGACALGNGSGEDVWYDYGTIDAGKTFEVAVTSGDVDIYLMATDDCIAFTCLASGETSASWVSVTGSEHVYIIIDYDTDQSEIGGAYSFTFEEINLYSGDYTVGDSSCDSSHRTCHLPFYGYYEYAIGQFCVPAAELASAGLAGDFEIKKIAFLQCTGTVDGSYNSLDIYMDEVASCPDLCPVSPAGIANSNLVATGASVSGSAGWKEITLDTPFIYHPGNAIIVTVCDSAPGYDFSYPYWASNAGEGVYASNDYTGAYACDGATEPDTCEDEWCSLGFDGDPWVAPTATPTETPIPPTNTPTNTPTETPAVTDTPVFTPTETPGGPTPTSPPIPTSGGMGVMLMVVLMTITLVAILGRRVRA